MSPTDFFAKLYERLEVGRRTFDRQLPLFGSHREKPQNVTEYLLRQGLRVLRVYLLRRRPVATRHLPLNLVELRFIRQRMVIYLWREMRLALSDERGFGHDIATRDFEAAELAQELFKETFDQLCAEYHLRPIRLSSIH
jgi:hypothetical protein